MKRVALLALALLVFSPAARAHEGSWFGFGAGLENLSSGVTETGPSLSLEGGYWYLGNVAYGGYFRSNFFGEIQSRVGSSLNIYDLGVFWKAATEAGLYGKLLVGMAFVSTSGNDAGFSTGNGISLSLGLGGGFLFPLTESLHIGPEVIYRHLTAGNGGDQISVGALVAYGF